MNYVPYTELVRDSVRLARQFDPAEILGVLGVPRSGMIPASVMAQELGCHLGDVYTYAETGEFSRTGHRMKWGDRLGGRILVIDDSVYSGRSMREALEALDGVQVTTGCVYVQPGMEDDVDVYARTLEAPRLFAWNWTASVFLSRCLLDMDGIICTDSDVFDDDGPEYVQALRDVRPLHIPRRKVRSIVTARLDRWRDLTAAWLDANGVECGTLEMAPFDTARERRGFGNARWKSTIYAADADAVLFIESSRPQAEEIHRRTGRPVLCLPDDRMYR